MVIIFYNIKIVVYFWSYKYTLGDHKKLQNESTPNFELAVYCTQQLLEINKHLVSESQYISSYDIKVKKQSKVAFCKNSGSSNVLKAAVWKRRPVSVCTVYQSGGIDLAAMSLFSSRGHVIWAIRIWGLSWMTCLLSPIPHMSALKSSSCGGSCGLMDRALDL